MNILFLIHRYPPALGGSERYIQEMAHRLVREGHRVTVYTSDQLEIEGFWRRGRPRLPAGRKDDEGVAVHRFRAHVLPLHGAISRLLGLLPWAPICLTMAPPGFLIPGLWQAIRTPADIDVVHASAYPSLMYLGAVAARRSHARLVLMPCSHPDQTARGTRAISYRDRRLTGLYRQADAIVALTEPEKSLLSDRGVSTAKIVVTGAGIEPAAAEGANGQRFRKKHGLPADSPLLTFVGHKTAGKGALHLLDACEELLAQRPGLSVAMVGASTPAFHRRYGALHPDLQARFLSLNLSERDKHDLLAASSALVLPSRKDSFGIVLLEAWLHGKPVVGARAGGIPAVIEDGENGLLVPYGDPTALRRAIAWLLDHPQEAERMGKRGREETLRKWTWGAVYQRLKPAYKIGQPA